MLRKCDGTDPNLIFTDAGPCNCGLEFDDVEQSVIFPHQRIISPVIAQIACELEDRFITVTLDGRGAKKPKPGDRIRSLDDIVEEVIQRTLPLFPEHEELVKKLAEELLA
jgi:hypothetical protein